MKRILVAAVFVFASLTQSDARLLIRELWDNVTNTSSGLKGLKGGTTSVGFNPAGVWVTSPTNDIFRFNAGAEIENFAIAANWDTILDGNNGTFASAGMLGGTTNGFLSTSYAYRALDTASRINFNTAGTNYFSVRLMKRGLWWQNDPPGTSTNNYGYDDAALGIGFLQGPTVTTNSHIVGAGFTRTLAANGGGGYLTEDGSTDLGDRVYITTGTLGQYGYTNHPGDSGGPYYARAYSSFPAVTGYLSGFPIMSDAYADAAWLVGRIITTAGGSTTMDVKVYVDADPVDTSPPTSWHATYSFSETGTMFYLLMWMHGDNRNNPCYIDAIRVATTWSEVIGLEILPITVSPTNTLYEGTPLTLSASAKWREDGVLITNEWYQWLKNGTNIPGAGGNGGAIAYTNLSPVPANSGTYSVAFSNDFGGGGILVTSPPVTLTVLAAIPPFFVLQPVSAARYTNAPTATFSVTPDGAFPFTYQWKKVSGGTTNALTDQTNKTLVLTNIQASDAAGYFVTVGNFVGSTNSAVANLTIVTPRPGSFEDAVVKNFPYAYWKMQETNGTVFHDYWGGHDGTNVDPAYVVTIVDTNVPPTFTNIFVAGVSLGFPGVQAAGFPPDHVAVWMPSTVPFGTALRSRVDMPALPIISNAMTFCCWVYNPADVDSTGHGNALITQRDRGNAGGYGIANSLKFAVYWPGPNYNQFGYQWGGGDVNPTAGYLGYQWTNSGIYLSHSNWTFVALVLETNRARIYSGTNGGPLTVATVALPQTLPSAVDSAFPGTVYSNSSPLAIGRHAWPFADDGESNAVANANVAMSDIAIFYTPLSPLSISNLYGAAVGQLITHTNTAGNLVLSWPLGALQSSTNISGPYTNVGATSPYTTPKTEKQRFYRAR